MINGPTQGASEGAADEWRASRTISITIRILAFVVPFAVAWFTVAGLSNLFLRPVGGLGVVVWLIQAILTGLAVSMSTDRFTKRALPLASLFNMTLVFPDRAPSRFGVALRSGTVRRRYAHQLHTNPTKRDSAASVSPIEAAARAVDLIGLLSRHDRRTRGHTERVRAYADLIAEELGVSPADRDRLAWGAMLHDLGKLSVPSEILNKPDAPDPAEWAILQTHPTAAAELIEPLRDWLGDWTNAAAEHHERWDGNGYPLGLAGTEISLAGRITAVADAYDVITSRRSYKTPLSAETARNELIRCAGTQFDPDVVRAFLNVSIRRRWFAGPLASLTELTNVINIGSSLPAASTLAAGAIVSVGAITAAPPPLVEAPLELGFVAPETTEAVVDEPSTTNRSTGSTTTEQALPAIRPAEASSPPTSGLQAEAGDTTTSSSATTVGDSISKPTPSTATLPTATGNGPDTTASSIATTATTNAPSTTRATTTVAPTTQAPTTAAPTTAPATTPTTAPTTAPTTTTTAPTTTTTASTTTTTAPTTTTTTPGSPLVVADSVSVEDDTDIKIHVLDNDDQGNSSFDEDTLEIITDPQHAGSFRIHNDHLHYQSVEDYEGPDLIEYRICNTNGLCDTGWVTIDVAD